jgi:hypothetical protein
VEVETLTQPIAESVPMPTPASVPAARPVLAAGARVAAIVPTDIEQTFRLAKAIAAAKWAPKSYLVDAKNPNLGFDESKIVVGIMHGLELGLTPIASLQSIAVINGVPSIFGDGALAVVQASGLLEDFREEPLVRDGKIVGYRCHAKRRGLASPIVQQFTIDDAQKARLLEKSGPWQEYRTRMLQMRARAWSLRAGFADVLRGLGIAEETQDIFDVSPSGTVTPINRTTKTKKDARAALDAFAGTAGAEPPPTGDTQGGDQGAPYEPRYHEADGQ